jgi:hypothetical protein
MTVKKKRIILTAFFLAALLFLLQLFQVSAQAVSKGDKSTEPKTGKAIKEYKNDKGFQERDYGDGIIMVYIPPGEFTMGSFTIGSYPRIRHEKPHLWVLTQKAHHRMVCWIWPGTSGSGARTGMMENIIWNPRLRTLPVRQSASPA